MTGLLTSWCLSEDIYELLMQEKIKDIDKIALLWGSIGGGFFVSDLVIEKDDESCDKYIEEKSNQLLEYVLKNQKKLSDTVSNKKIVMSYTIGLSLFCGIMKNINPMIEYNTDIITKESDEFQDREYIKNKVWSNTDIIILRYCTGELPDEVNLKKLFVTDDTLKTLITTIYNDFCESIELTKSKDEILKSIDNFIKLLGKLNDKSTLKKLFIQKIEKYSGKKSLITSMMYSMLEDDDYDYSNSNKDEWIYNDEKSTEDVFQLYEKTKNMGVEAGYRILHM